MSASGGSVIGNMPIFFRYAVPIFWAGRTFNPQELAKELKKLRVSEWEIPTLVCVAQNASALTTNNTSHLHMTNIRQTMSYYGLFGFPEEWLERCDLTKEQILDDDIQNEVNCLLMFLQTTDRKGAIHHLTPGEVDLDKCLDWWDQLPPNLEFDSPGTMSPPEAHCAPSQRDFSTLTSLLILDIILGIMAYFLYMIVRYQRRPSGDTISNFPLV